MTTFYPDVSNHQGAMSIAGASACVAKATEGTTFRDRFYTHYRDQALAMGIPFAAYHWLHKTDIAAQARNAFAVVGPSIPLMIDDEDTNDGLDIKRTLTFVAEYRKLGGVVTLEYLPRWFWRNYGSPDLRPLAEAGLSIVSSAYTTYSETGVGWAPYGGVSPAIWQYTSSATFNGATGVDFNAFKGTVEQLRALFHGKSTEEHEMVAVIQTTDKDGNTVFVNPAVHTFSRVPKAPAGADPYWPLLNKLSAYSATGVTVVQGPAIGWKGGYDMDDPATWVWAGVEVKPEGEVTLSDDDLAKVAAAAEKGAEAGAPTREELVDAAFEGAQQAEDK